MQPDPYTHLRLLEQDLDRRLAQRQLEHAARAGSRRPSIWPRLIAAAGRLASRARSRGARTTAVQQVRATPEDA
jgi:hypothetical protein